MGLREVGSTDVMDLLPGVWKVGAAIALVVMVGSWVRRDRPYRPVEASVDQRTYRRDSLTGIATVPVRVEARSGVRLSGCPAPPVVVFQLRTDSGWVDHLQLNRPCNPQTVEQRVDLTKGQAVNAVGQLRVAGQYRVGVVATRWQQVRWIPGEQFTVK